MYETWKPIEGAINYEVSNFGRVRNIKTKNILNGAISKGYVRYDLSINGKRCVKAGHRLVAEAFLPQIAGKDFVNHKDGDKTNNNLANLEWCTCQENSQHAYTQLGVEPVNQKPVRCIETGVIYKSCSEAERCTGIPNNKINMCCNKRKKTVHNTHWEFVLK